MARYYDIHTHKTSVTTPDNLSIQSLYENFHEILPGHSYSIGLHPAYLHDYESQLHILHEMAKLDEVLAIGECGLDKLVHTPMPLQISLFIKQIDLANQLRKPLIIHCVQAHEELLQLLQQHPPLVPVIIHGYNKRDTIAEKFVDKGCYLSFGSALLRQTSPAIEVLRSMPADRFFLETDDAEISIEDIYTRAAAIRNTTLESLILQIANNYENVFTTP